MGDGVAKLAGRSDVDLLTTWDVDAKGQSLASGAVGEDCGGVLICRILVFNPTQEQEKHTVRTVDLWNIWAVSRSGLIQVEPAATGVNAA